MGWTYTYKEKGKSVFDFFKERFGWENENATGEVIACGVKNFRTAYLAYKTTVKATGESSVTACVCLLAYSPKDMYNFGFKDIGEEMGPCETDCPESILKLLTPITPGVNTTEYALKWREACWAKVQARKEANKVKRALKKSLDKN